MDTSVSPTEPRPAQAEASGSWSRRPISTLLPTWLPTQCSSGRLAAGPRDGLRVASDDRKGQRQEGPEPPLAAAVLP